MGTKYIFNRRTLLGTSVALTAAGLLAACGGDKKEEKKKGAGKDAKPEELYNVNAHPVSDLKQGGTVRIPVRSMDGGNFNTLTTPGNSHDNGLVMNTIHDAGIWDVDFLGKSSLRKEYAESFDIKEESGKVVVHIKLNPKAKFNDGTPIDIKALQATWKVRKNAEGPYKIVTAGIYANIEKIESEGNNFSAKVIFSKPYYPIEANLFDKIVHPALEDEKVFNDGFVNNPHAEYGCGPFKLADNGWNSGEKTLTVVPNDKWWGEKPVLESIIFRQMEESAARAAFKNGEIDAVEANKTTNYTELKNTNGAEVRAGQRLFAGGFVINPKKITDQKVRKALFVGVDRQKILNANYQGLPYEEEPSGSMLTLPSSPYYTDNYPKVEGSPQEAVQKLLEGAGYKKGDDGIYAKDNKKLEYKVTIFGDDPVTIGTGRAFVESMRSLGLGFNLDNQPSGNFNKVVGERQYDVTLSGYTVSPDGTAAAEQYYLKENNNGVGSDAIDKMIREAFLIKDNAERNKLCNEIEKKHMDEVSTIITVFNGPEYFVCKKELANYGPSLYKGSPEGSYFLATDWAKVGWLK